MNTELSTPTGPIEAESPPANLRKPRFGWVLLALVAVFWAVPFVLKQLDFPIYAGFFSSVGTVGVLTLAFTAWWFTYGGGRLRDRFLIFLSIIAIGFVVSRLIDQSVGAMGFVFFGVPVGLSAVIIWLFLTRNRSAALRNWGMLTAFALVCGSMTLMRVDGIDGNQMAATNWRWTKSAEDLYLASRSANGAGPASPSAKNGAIPPTLVAKPGDWAEFRGTNRRGEVHGMKIATDWESHPPKQVWRQRIGPAWSSMLILGDRLITQEQRGDSEAIVSLDAATGREVWAHQYKARFSDGQAGAGPRSSPSFADGRIYTLGGSGVLSCLESGSGKPCWSRDIVADSGAPLPMWGFSSSPLIVDGLVVVYAGGKGDKGLPITTRPANRPGRRPQVRSAIVRRKLRPCTASGKCSFSAIQA